MQLAAVDLGADADDGAPRIECVREQIEHGRPPLEHVEQVVARLELGPARVAEQPRCAADEELRAVVRDRVDERRPQPRRGTRARCAGSARVLEPAPQRRRAQAQADDLLLEVRARPVDEPRVDRLLELEHALRDAACRGDHDDDDCARLELEHVDVTHRGGPERGRRDEREQARRLGQRLGGAAERCLELLPDRGDVEPERLGTTVDRADELLGVDAVAALRRNAAGGGVRMRQKAERLQLRELRAHGRRRDTHARALDEHLRPDGLAGRDVLLDHPSQDLAPARGELFHVHDRTRRRDRRARAAVALRACCVLGAARRARRRASHSRPPVASGTSRTARSAVTQELTRRVAIDRTSRVRIDVDAADHVAAGAIETEYVNPDGSRSPRMPLEIAEVLLQRHLVWPRAAREAGRRVDVGDRGRPRRVVRVVVLRPERLEHEVGRHEAGWRLEVGGHERSALPCSDHSRGAASERRPPRPSGQQLRRHGAAEEPPARVSVIVARSPPRRPPRARLAPSAPARRRRSRARAPRGAAARRGAARASAAPAPASARRAPRARAAARHPPEARPRTARSTGVAPPDTAGSKPPRSRHRGSRARASSPGCGVRGDHGRRPAPGRDRSSPSRTSGSRPPVSVSTTRSKYPSIASAWRSSSEPQACVNRVPGFASSS